MATKEENSAPKREYARIVLTLENVLVPTEKLSPTPSMLDGLDNETEMDLRILGCELIQTAGILLKLPQVSFQIKMASKPLSQFQPVGFASGFIFLKPMSCMCIFGILGGNGNGASHFPAVLLLEVLREAQYGGELVVSFHSQSINFVSPCAVATCLSLKNRGFPRVEITLCLSNRIYDSSW